MTDAPEPVIIKPVWPASEKVVAGVTTRDGGCSTNPFDSFNLALHVGDEASLVQRNRQSLQARLDPQVELRWLDQVHSNIAIEADIGNVPEANTSNVQEANASNTPEADAMFTARRNIACSVLTADCLPVFICDDAASKVAVIHAGWRGLAAGIVQNTVAAMLRDLAGKKTPQLYAWLGPAIGPDHFIVGEEVKTAFLKQSADPTATAAAFQPQHGKYLADIYQLANVALHAAGVRHIYGGGFCTVCDPRFYSYRRDGTTGRMASFIYLRD